MTCSTVHLADPDENAGPLGTGRGADESRARSEARDDGAPGHQGGVPRDAGMATAEYAIATLAACGFAGLLLTILRGNEVKGLLLGIVRSALSIG